MNNDNKGISVLISVYKNEKAEFLKLSIQSMLNQTRKPDEIVIVEDGPLTDELYNMLDYLYESNPSLIRRLTLQKNMGLGLALKYGVENCNYTLIARMDSDDISVSKRLEIQEIEFEKNPQLDILGGFIEEFIDDISKPISVRKVPLTQLDIKKYQRRRSAFNHMTVMFKKDSVIKAGNYEHGLFMEDDLLWLNMISNGANLKNLPAILCHVRVGNGMFKRRGGLGYLKHYTVARYKMFKRNQISRLDFLSTFFIQVVISAIPDRFRKIIFINYLRSNYSFGENDEYNKTL